MLLAYEDKSWLIDSADEKRVWRSGGRVQAVVLANGLEPAEVAIATAETS